MNRHLPSLTALQCFEACARHLNVTRAGEELFLTQSAVSRQIKHLEDLLGCSLFERTNQGLELTEEGAGYAHEITEALKQLEKAVMPVNPQDHLLKVAGENSLISYWLFPRLPDFRHEHPETRIELVTDLNQVYKSNPDFDVAFIYGPGNWPGLSTWFLMKETFVAVCVPELLGKDGPVDECEEITRFNLLHTNALSPAQEWLKQCGLETSTIPEQQGQRFETFQLLLQAAHQGWGVAVLPYYFVRKDLEKGRLVYACRKTLTCQDNYYVAVPDNKKDSTQISDFVEWVLKEIAPQMQAGGIRGE